MIPVSSAAVFRSEGLRFGSAQGVEPTAASAVASLTTIGHLEHVAADLLLWTWMIGRDGCLVCSKPCN